jgi:hypothetical protein
MGDFVHVYNEGGGIRNVNVPEGSRSIAGTRTGTDNPGTFTVAACGIPFIIPPGDGSANGLQFTGTLGNFTLSAAILPNLWNGLKGCYIYLQANFGGRTYPAGWYWAVFSSDTNGILYIDTYQSGIPVRPATPTPFPVNLTGWLTTTTSEITGPTGFVLPGGSMGKNGALKIHFRTIGNVTATKTFKMYLDSTMVSAVTTTTLPVLESICSCRNQGSLSSQFNTQSNGPTGVGTTFASLPAGAMTSVDTSSDRTISISLQNSTTAACAVLLHADITCTYGA